MGSDDPRQLIGSVIADRYRVQDCLGTGTMGAVYRAEHIHMKKVVALKVLHPTHVKDPEVVERFHREAQAAANIEHPNICNATDFGKLDDDFYYLVMEFLDGRPLIDAIRSGEPFSVERCLHIGTQILAGLEKAHSSNVVHRDVKPENVLLIEKGGDPDFVKITDFGVAQVRLFKDAARLTQAGVVYGSPLYMSPQQAAGKEIDHRADLYSVGIMLYELLTGTLPFYAKTLMVVLNMHISDPPPPFSEANEHIRIDPELEAVVMKLLAKNPDDRFQSATEVREKLEEIRDRLFGDSERATLAGTMQGVLGIVSAGMAKRIAMTGALFLMGLLTLWGLLAIANWSDGDGDEDDGASVGEAMEFDEADEAVRIEDRRLIFESDPVVKKTIALIATSPEEAVVTFDTLLDGEPKNPHLHYYRGRALIAAKQYAEGFAAYSKAIEIDPTYVNDIGLQDDVMQRLERGNDEELAAAEALIRTSIKEQANGRLSELAELHKVKKVRRRALEILKDTNQFEALPRWNQLTIELRHAKGCDDNKAIVVELAELGDPRALGALRRFGAKGTTGCGKNKREDCYACLRQDLRVAIEKLETKLNTALNTPQGDQ